jgi:hypothetical protein
MNNTSWRHHYIPEFYLKGFTDVNGFFKIYDVKKQSFKRNGKDFSPESHFFEKNGNTVFINNKADDFIETKYFSHTDNRIAILFDKIKNSEADTNFGLSDDDMPILQHFVSIMFWRVPTNYEQIKYLLKTKDLKAFGLILKSTKTGEEVKDESFENKLRNDPNFFKAIKHILPYVTFKRLFDCRTPLRLQTVPEQLPAICSDNPIIFEESIFPDLYFDDFIFPISHKHVFIRGKIRDDVYNTIKIKIDLILLKQAKKYVSCTDQLYIEMLNKLFDDNYNSIDELKKEVFNELIEK